MFSRQQVDVTTMLSLDNIHDLANELQIGIYPSEHEFFKKVYNNFYNNFKDKISEYGVAVNDQQLYDYLLDDTNLVPFLLNNSEDEFIKPFYIYYKHLDSDLLMYDFIKRKIHNNLTEITQLINRYFVNTETIYIRICILQVIHFIAHSISINEYHNTLCRFSYDKKKYNNMLFSMFNNAKEKGHDIIKIAFKLQDLINLDHPDTSDIPPEYLTNIKKLCPSELPGIFKLIEYTKRLKKPTIKSMKEIPDFEILLLNDKCKPSTYKSFNNIVKYSLVYNLATEYDLDSMKQVILNAKPDELVEIYDVIEV